MVVRRTWLTCRRRRLPIDVLVVTGGHPFEAEPFFAVFDAMPDIRWTAASRTGGRPRCRRLLRHARAAVHPQRSSARDDRTQRRPARGDRSSCAPTASGLVFLHHAIASWPAWPEYAELVGGRFHYAPGTLGGTAYPDSGYRFDVRHTVEVLQPDHPVCAGLGDSFTLTDELYCFPVLEHTITPLMRTTFDTADASKFSSADLAIRGQRNSNEGWSHPAGQRPGRLGQDGRRVTRGVPAVRRRPGDLRRSQLPTSRRQRDQLDRIEA